MEKYDLQGNWRLTVKGGHSPTYQNEKASMSWTLGKYGDGHLLKKEVDARCWEGLKSNWKEKT